VANAAEMRDAIDGVGGDPVVEQAMLEERADQTAPVVVGLLSVNSVVDGLERDFGRGS
jgi:hypothetical protein